MRSPVPLLRLIVCCAVTCVWGVAGFAQSDTDAPGATASVNIAREYVPAAYNTPTTVELPSNLVIHPRYARVVDEMLSGSTTFRRQCQRLGRASHLTVVVERTLEPRRQVRAWATISLSGHSIRALVRIAGEGNEPELIAHELEHVIEYLDNVDLPAKARLESSGVYDCECGASAYETSRAVHVGRKVARELRNSQ
jgi:hypothetical protein